MSSLVLPGRDAPRATAAESTARHAARGRPGHDSRRPASDIVGGAGRAFRSPRSLRSVAGEMSATGPDGLRLAAGTDLLRHPANSVHDGVLRHDGPRLSHK